MRKLTGFLAIFFILLMGNQAVFASEWDNFSTSDQTPIHVDCQADVNSNNPGNGPGQPAGLPVDIGGPYGNTAGANWNSSYTIYTANYMNWYHGVQNLQDRSRLEIAKEVVTDLIEANPGIDFGAMVFNSNYSSSDSGGRVIQRMIDNMSTGQRNSLVTMIDGLNTDAYTPLCETTYEAKLYLAGEDVYYGNDDPGASPSRDMAAESGGTYNSPLSNCQYTYLILMTDGEPTRDSDANSAVEGLTGNTCGSYNGTKSCLPELAEYLFETDLDDDPDNGTQRAVTYTIGFHTDQELLSDTAQAGGGVYYTATTAEELSEAFQGAVLEILSSEGTFNSPTVAVDTFNRTRSRDDLFMAMFEPKSGARWPGNIKKFKVHVSGGTAEIRDANDNPAIDITNGHIRDTATSFWSSGMDGPNVEEGGVGELLAARTPSTRTIKTNSGTSGALENFNSANLTRDVYGLSTDAELFILFDVIDQAAMDDLISFARGVDVNDEDNDGSNTDNLDWILGDILHSEPLAINYGALGSYTTADPDIRLVVGTNAGFLHMFGTSDGVEDWAFFPKELAPVLSDRLVNSVTTSHKYGIDASPVVYTRDVNRDGTLSAAAGDKVFLYFGLRRGGRAYYALDISNPGSPSFKWMIDNDTSGFSELGQTWSVPVLTTVPGYVDGSGNHKPVIIFGGGFHASNKDTTLIASPDTKGQAVYIVDADTGALLWSVSQMPTASPNLQELTLEHGIVTKPVVLDSNGDGVTDRIYVADTGGNVWRVDLPGADRSKWNIVKLADFNDSTVAGDRRFFNSPDIVRTRNGAMTFDAVLLGSGERNNPIATDVTNRFYMIQDRQVTPYYDANPTAAQCGISGSPGPRYSDFRCQLPLDESDLYDATDNLIQDGTSAEITAAQGTLYSKTGWYITLEKTGEKSLASSITIGGNVVFTTFVPEVTNANVCIPEPGQGYLYATNLLNASSVYNFTGEIGTLDKTDRITTMGMMILNTPSPHVGNDGRIRLIFPAGGTDGTSVEEMEGSIFDTEDDLDGAKGAYWYQEEY